MGFDKRLKKLKELKLRTARAVKTMCKNVKNAVVILPTNPPLIVEPPITTITA